MTARKTMPYGSPQVHFPEDEGSHPKMLTEWWYGNFALRDLKGREYGAMVAYFNAGIRILSISDLNLKRLYPEVSISTAQCDTGALELCWGSEDRWFRTKQDTLTYRLECHGKGIGLNLDLNSNKPPLLVGGNGLVEWPFGSSYYYSLSSLQARGQLMTSGQTTNVKGIGWMDHQWMNFLPKMVERGYAWFSVQLNNGIEMVFWQVVNPDKSIESRDMTTMSPGNSIYHTRNFALDSIAAWTSPESGRQYGVHWRVEEQTQGLDLDIRARYPEQEISMSEVLGFNHAVWEGRTAISGHIKGKPASGTGYAELIALPSRA